MSFDPTNFRTWTSFKDHPIYGPRKSDIGNWSHDPSQYDELTKYGQCMIEHYVHWNPQPLVPFQEEIAQRDIVNFSKACEQLENKFGEVQYELVILDDFTAYVWMIHPSFKINVHACYPDENSILRIFIDFPDVGESEIECPTVTSLVNKLSHLISGT